jgi:hypothetical protein
MELKRPSFEVVHHKSVSLLNTCYQKFNERYRKTYVDLLLKLLIRPGVIVRIVLGPNYCLLVDSLRFFCCMLP